ncbi:MAG: hypothetical protein ACYSU0_03665, partial [Planctomycetota bacterium]
MSRPSPVPLALLLCAAGCVRPELDTFPGGGRPRKSTEELIAALDDAVAMTRGYAAADLAECDGGGIVPAVRERLGKEEDPAAKLALHCALAAHGEWESVGLLVAALDKARHSAAWYLHKVTGHDWGWPAERWRRWLEEAGEEGFRKLLERRRVEKVWRPFAQAYSSQFFLSSRKRMGMRASLTADEVRLLKESPEADAWITFAAAVCSLHDRGDRPEAARLFRTVFAEHPMSYYAEDSRELAGLLDKMIEEDRAWKEPEDIEKLNLEEKVRYNVHRLRDVACYQTSQPGMCDVTSDWAQKEGTYNAAIELLKIGEPAIPALIEVLDDRRPTRSVGHWRHFWPTHTVLRCQDAAIQVLDELLPAALYRRSSTSAYFSTEPPAVRREATARIRRWHERSKGKTAVEKMWIAVEERPGIYPLLDLLTSLAFDHGHKQRVLGELRKLYDERDPYQRPQISHLMCRLGDTSNVPEVTKQYLEGEYRRRRSLPDDPCAQSSAEEHALRQLVAYGRAEEHALLHRQILKVDDPASRGPVVAGDLISLA